uniref:Uncharacterized protein n=1 Tax=Oryza punctata TaxID=4537 RepID=A0A0E0MKT7_ORYPU
MEDDERRDGDELIADYVDCLMSLNTNSRSCQNDTLILEGARDDVEDASRVYLIEGEGKQGSATAYKRGMEDGYERRWRRISWMRLSPSDRGTGANAAEDVSCRHRWYGRDSCRLHASAPVVGAGGAAVGEERRKKTGRKDMDGKRDDSGTAQFYKIPVV